MKTSILPLAATVLAAIAAPAGAQDAPLSIDAPVAVSTCYMGDFERMSPVESGPVSDGRTLYLSFANAWSQNADRVTFSVSHGGKRYEIVDAGRFSPGVHIAHRFFGFANDYAGAGGADACVVETAHFTDGSTWSRPVKQAKSLENLRKKSSVRGSAGVSSS